MNVPESNADHGFAYARSVLYPSGWRRDLCRAVCCLGTCDEPGKIERTLFTLLLVGEEKYVAKAKELIDSAQAEISLSIWRELFEVLRSNIENAISRGIKVYIFTFESILVEGATVYSYNINDVSTLFPYRRTTIIIDGGECLVGEEGDRNVYAHTRNHSVVSLATDEIVLNVFWNKLIEKENLLSKGCSGADFLQAIHNLAERYGITDEMTKNFLVYNFQKEKTQNGKKR